MVGLGQDHEGNKSSKLLPIALLKTGVEKLQNGF